MALTKVTGKVVKTDTGLTVGVITAVTATFTGNVSVAGTLTYDDVTNVDSVGLITARSGIDITGGGGLNLTGGAGIITATRYRVGTAATLDASGLSVSAGVVTATTYRVGTAATLDASGLSVSAGVVTATRYRVGTAATLDASGLSVTAGVVTATTYRVGAAATLDASGLSVSAGIITATRYRVGTAATLDASGLSVTAGVVTATTLRIGGGSTAAPSITPTGDSDTGIFFPSADTIAFGEGGSEAARIDSSGRVGIGVTSPLTALECRGQFSVSNSSSSYWVLDRDDSDGRLKFLDSSTSTNERLAIDSSGRLLVGTIASPAHQLQVSTDSAGKPSTNTWTIVSDERIKEDIELANLDLCYEAVKSIPLKRFKWKDEIYTEEQVRDRRKIGWIAQDVEAVFPKAVGIYEFKYNQVFKEITVPAVEEELDSDGNVITPAQPERIEKGELISEEVIKDCRDLNADQLYAAMYGAIQKLIAKVESLEAEVAALKAQ